ncbi:two-component regulator propeller domain-containing protein, partial [Aquiflexum sp.]|uniref:ligand-binding sensor domain-containing protein n=1 Tax=Aquiflexum sp. TaxID=1872584 RepID=UPI0035943879
MKSVCFIAWMFFCSLVYSKAPAQSDIQIRSWGQAHGIESAVIYGVFRDQNDLIWICTYNGLFYFDGFRAYKSPILEMDGKTSFDGIVSQLVQSSDGRYWLKLDQPMGAYDIYSKIFTPLKTQPSNLLSTFSSVGDQLYVVDPIKFYLVDRQSLEIIPMVFVDNKGKINSEIVKLNGLTREFYSFVDGLPVEVIPSSKKGEYIQKVGSDFFVTHRNQNGYYKYNADSKGNTWYRHGSGMDWIVEDTLGENVSEKYLAQFEGMTIHYLLTQPDFTWFITDKGVIIWEKDEDNPRFLSEEIPELNQTDLVNFFDLGKTLWIWNRAGISNIRPNSSKFKSITKENSKLFSNFILGIYPFDEKRLIIKHDFTDLYYSLFDLQTGVLSTVHWEEIFKNFGLVEYLNIKRHGDPKIWIINNGKHLHDFFHSNANKTLFTYSFISNGNTYEYFVYPPDEFELSNQLWSIPDNRMVFPKISPLQYAQQGDTVWIGTESEGLIALHTPSGQTQQWLSEPGRSESIPANRVHAVIPVDNGNLWLGTGNGLSFFNKKTGKFKTYRTQDGLIDNRIYCMAFDQSGHLWIGTGNGLSRFDTLSKSFTNFTKADGLVNTEYNRNSAMLLPDGR